MATVRGYLTLLNQTLVIPLPEGFNGGVAVQYGSKGADNATASSGTIVLQGSVNWRPSVAGATPGNPVTSPLLQIDWVTLDMKNPATAPPSDILLLSAVGIGLAEVIGYTAIQVLMSVAGGVQGVDVAVQYNWF